VLEKFSPDRTVTLDFRNSEKGTKQIIDFARRYPLQAIVAVDEDTTVLAAKASEALGLPHNSPSSVGAAANKYRFRTVLAEAGLPSPGFTVVSRGDDPIEVAHRVEYPCVLKPLALRQPRRDPGRRSGRVSPPFYRIGRILNDAYAGPLAGTGGYILARPSRN
jgi:hypothetical protein